MVAPSKSIQKIHLQVLYMHYFDMNDIKDIDVHSTHGPFIAAVVLGSASNETAAFIRFIGGKLNDSTGACATVLSTSRVRIVKRHVCNGIGWFTVDQCDDVAFRVLACIACVLSRVGVDGSFEFRIAATWTSVCVARLSRWTGQDKEFPRFSVNNGRFFLSEPSQVGRLYCKPSCKQENERYDVVDQSFHGEKYCVWGWYAFDSL